MKEGYMKNYYNYRVLSSLALEINNKESWRAK